MTVSHKNMPSTRGRSSDGLSASALARLMICLTTPPSTVKLIVLSPIAAELLIAYEKQKETLTLTQITNGVRYTS